MEYSNKNLEFYLRFYWKEISDTTFSEQCDEIPMLFVNYESFKNVQVLRKKQHFAFSFGDIVDNRYKKMWYECHPVYVLKVYFVRLFTTLYGLGLSMHPQNIPWCLMKTKMYYFFLDARQK